MSERNKTRILEKSTRAQDPGDRELPKTPEPEDNWKHRSEGMKCKTCMWYVEKKSPVGRCRYNPPCQKSGFPVVFETDWCGQHRIDEEKIKED